MSGLQKLGDDRVQILIISNIAKTDGEIHIIWHENLDSSRKTIMGYPGMK